MTDHDDTADLRPDQELAGDLELAGSGLGTIDAGDLSLAGRLIRHAGRLVDALGLDHIAQERGLELVLAELVLDTRQAGHDLDLELGRLELRVVIEADTSDLRAALEHAQLLDAYTARMDLDDGSVD